jgi:hypothetical protein
VLRRLAARLLTSPVAFLFAGVIDVSAFAFATLRAALRKRLGSLLRRDL